MCEGKLALNIIFLFKEIKRCDVHLYSTPWVDIWSHFSQQSQLKMFWQMVPSTSSMAFSTVAQAQLDWMETENSVNGTGKQSY